MIEVFQLSKRFTLPGGGEIHAVDQLSFRVEPGEVYGLLGANGAGKTTTVRMILGLMRPTSGWSAIAGYRSTQSPQEVKRRVGLVAAGVGVYPQHTVREALLFFADLYGMSPLDAAEELEALVERFDLGEFLDQPCSTLSTGQKQRLSLARALIHRPPVLLLDEPTLGLDVVGAQVVFEFLGELKKAGKAVVLSTHRLDEAERVCDRFGLIEHGRLLREGTLADLRAESGRERLVDVFLHFTSRDHSREIASFSASSPVA